MEPVFFVAGVVCGAALLYFWPKIQNVFVGEEKVLITGAKNTVAKAEDAITKEVKKVL
jgi:hypothetical protein